MSEKPTEPRARPKKPKRKPDGRPKTNTARTAAAAKQFEIAERRNQVSQLKIHRVPHSEIAKRLGVSKGTIQNDVDAIMVEWAESTIRNAHERYLTSVARLDYLQQVLAPEIQAGDKAAIALDLQIERRRAALEGLDADQRAKSGMRVEPPEPPIEIETAEVLTSDGRPVGKGDAARIYAAFTPKDPAATPGGSLPAPDGGGSPQIG